MCRTQTGSKCSIAKRQTQTSENPVHTRSTSVKKRLPLVPNIFWSLCQNWEIAPFMWSEDWYHHVFQCRSFVGWLVFSPYTKFPYLQMMQNFPKQNCDWHGQQCSLPWRLQPEYIFLKFPLLPSSVPGLLFVISQQNPARPFKPDFPNNQKICSYRSLYMVPTKPLQIDKLQSFGPGLQSKQVFNQALASCCLYKHTISLT